MFSSTKGIDYSNCKNCDGTKQCGYELRQSPYDQCAWSAQSKLDQEQINKLAKEGGLEKSLSTKIEKKIELK